MFLSVFRAVERRTRGAGADERHLPPRSRMGTAPIATASISALCSNDDQLALPSLRHQALLCLAPKALMDLLVWFSPDLRQEILISVLVEHQLGVGRASFSC